MFLTAHNIASALSPRPIKTGTGWMVRCPAHDDGTPSLHISDGADGVVFYCHAGCSQSAVLGRLMAIGLWSQPRDRAEGVAFRQQVSRHVDEATPKSAAVVAGILAAALPAAGTIAETYLRSRGITCSLPPALKSLPGERCMVAEVRSTVTFDAIACQKTFLASDGSGKADVRPVRKTYGSAKGGVVCLGEVDTAVVIAEGVESALSASILTGLPAWATLGTSGMAAAQIPYDVRSITIFADGDEPGKAAAAKLAARLKEDGRAPSVIIPRGGLDANDILRRRCGEAAGEKVAST